MITYSQQLIDFVISVKNNKFDINTANKDLLKESMDLQCVVLDNNKVILTERGEVVSRITVHYESQLKFDGFHWAIFFSTLVFLFTFVQILVQNHIISTLSGAITMTITFLMFSTLFLYGSQPDGKRRVQLINN